MKAIIFSAGLGTRFKPWTDKHPKALALVNGKSLLQRNIEYLQQTQQHITIVLRFKNISVYCSFNCFLKKLHIIIQQIIFPIIR